MRVERCPVSVCQDRGGVTGKRYTESWTSCFRSTSALLINLQSFTERQKQAAEDTSAAPSLPPSAPPWLSQGSGKTPHAQTPTPPRNTLGRPWHAGTSPSSDTKPASNLSCLICAWLTMLSHRGWARLLQDTESTINTINIAKPWIFSIRCGKKKNSIPRGKKMTGWMI